MNPEAIFDELTDFSENLDEIINNYKPERQPDESYEEYKMRREIRKIAEKRYMQRGTLYWDSTTNGTYIRGSRF